MAPPQWPPGFRFHPTDEELVLYYLKRKICHRKLKLDIVAEVDVYKCEPDDLPGLALLKNGDRQWFFFSPRDRKYPHGSRSNRATKQGYWKATGKDRAITCNSRNVGNKKTLVFYRGRAPSGARTDWVMHEYTLEEDELKRCQNVQDYYAIYKVFKKSGPGPKNGEQYGAPFREEDWVDEEGEDIIRTDGKVSDVPLVTKGSVDYSCGTARVDASVDERAPQPLTVEDFLSPLSVSNFSGVVDHVAEKPAPQSAYVDDFEETPSPESCRTALVDPLVGDFLGTVQHVVDEPVPVPGGIDNVGQACRTAMVDPSVSNYNAQRVVEPVPQPVDFEDFEEALRMFMAEELNQSTVNDGSFGEVVPPEPCTTYAQSMQQNDWTPVSQNGFPRALFDTRQSTPSGSQSSNLAENFGFSSFELQQNVTDDGFLEMDDLGTEPISSANNVLLPPHSGDSLQETLRMTEDGNLREFDTYFDADSFLRNSAPVDQDILPLPDTGNTFGDQFWNYDANTSFPIFRQPVQGSVPLPTTGVENTGASSINADLNQNHSGNGAEDSQTWFSSTLWSFVESIPAAPASAAESALMNKTFQRMSSFRKLKVNAKSSIAAASGSVSKPAKAGGGGGVKGLFLFSTFIALFALFCVVIGSNVSSCTKSHCHMNL